MERAAVLLRRIVCIVAGAFAMLLVITASCPRDAAGQEQIILTPAEPIAYWPLPRYYIPQIPLSQPLQKYTYDLCLQEEVDYELVLAVIWNESRFDGTAVNVNYDGSRDSGLMQINDINAKWIEDELGVDNLFDAEQNILVGVTVLGRFVRKYGEYDGLMAYNLGEAGMRRAKEQGINTLDSVDKLLKKRDIFDQMRKFT